MHVNNTSIQLFNLKSNKIHRYKDLKLYFYSII